MKKVKSIIGVVVLCTILGFVYLITSSHKDSNIEGSITTILSKNGIKIIGKSDDLGVFKRPNLQNNTYLFGKPHEKTEVSVVGNSGEITLKEIHKPLLMEFMPSGEKKLYSAFIYVSPNDVVEFEIKDEKMVFTGENADQNNLYIALDSLTPDYANSPYKGDLLQYKENIKAIYSEKKEFVANYYKTHKVSKDFIDVFNEHLEFEYYDNLISPRNVKANSMDFYFNEADCLKNLIHKEREKRERVVNLTAYLDRIDIQKFANPRALRHSFFFKNSINQFIRHYFETSDHPLFSLEKLKAEKEYIENHLKGDVKKYALGRMIRDYYNKGITYNSKNKTYMLDLIDEYIQTVSDKASYVKKMEDIKNEILLYDFELSESALNAKMVNHLSDTITLQDIFNRSDKRIKVVDFWASWCPPCIKQIKENKAFKDRLTVENNVEWVYLSIDTDKEKWLQRNKELSETLHFRNSYILIKGKKSALAKALQVSQIPRYVIFGNDGKVLMHSAPSPSNTTVFERMIDDMQPHSPIQ
jgi:thiol-disulfide isomerase/thioredoxin